MRIYLELTEILPEGFTEEADFIRIDIEWDQRDVDTAISLLREHAQVYEHYVVQLHFCGHEDGEPCSVTVLELR